VDTKYKYARGQRVQIVSGSLTRMIGTVDSCAFQTSVDHPGERAPGYHMVLDDRTVVTIRWDQIYPLGTGS